MGGDSPKATKPPELNHQMKKNTRRRKAKRRSRTEETQLLQLRKKLGITTIADLRQQAIERAVSLTKGDKIVAAALLGIGKTSLYRALR